MKIEMKFKSIQISPGIIYAHRQMFAYYGQLNFDVLFVVDAKGGGGVHVI